MCTFREVCELWVGWLLFQGAVKIPDTSMPVTQSVPSESLFFQCVKLELRMLRSVVIHEFTRVITWLGSSISVQVLTCADHVLQVVTTSSTCRRSLTAKPSSASTSASRSASERVTSSAQSSCTRVIQQPLALRRTCQPKTYLSSFSGIVMIIR